MMEKCRLITAHELSRFLRQRSDFQPLPVWVEIHKSYRGGLWPSKKTYGAAVLSGFFTDVCDSENLMVYLDGCRGFHFMSYGYSWRLWYACSDQLPAFETEPWENRSSDGQKEAYS
jgi:hypothetical protein